MAMKKLNDKLHLSEESSMIVTPDGVESVRPYQIILWVAIAPKRVFTDSRRLRFPTVLDTGLNHNCAIRQQQYNGWNLPSVPRRGQVRIGRTIVPLLDANLWLYANDAGRTTVSDREPFLLELPEGIAVYPDDSANPPRLPTLGLRAMLRNKLRVVIDGRKRHLSIYSGQSYWF
jgi:hypothetical protein